MRSIKIQTADTTLLKRITSPHEVVYTSAGQPAVYKDMSDILFVSGYIKVMAGKRDQVKPGMLQHLQELMEDAQSYIREPVKAYMYHGIWLHRWNKGELLG